MSMRPTLFSVLMAIWVLLFISAIPADVTSGLKIKSVTDWVTVVNNGQKVTYKDEYKEYDKQGNRIVLINFRKDGTIRLKEVSRYDKFGNRIEKSSYEEVKDQAAEIKRNHKTYVFNAYREKTEENEYNTKGEIKSKTLFTYNGDGKCVSEIKYNKDGRLIQKVLLTYNKSKAIAEKVTLSGDGDTLKLQKYLYEMHP